MRGILKDKKFVEVKRILIFTLILISIQATIFFLPFDIKPKLVLNPENPTILSFYLNHFTHFSPNHFLQNIFSFLFIMFLFIIFSMKTKDSIKISKVLFSATIFLPIFISASVLLISSILNYESNFLGFSGILSSFYGIFLVILFTHFLKTSISTSIIFFISIISIYLTTYFFYFERIFPPALKILLFIMIPITILYFLYATIQLIKSKRIIKERKAKLLLILSPIIIFFLIFTPLFPIEIVQEGSRVGIEVHFIGLILGFFWIYFLQFTEKIKNKIYLLL